MKGKAKVRGSPWARDRKWDEVSELRYIRKIIEGGQGKSEVWGSDLHTWESLELKVP